MMFTFNYDERDKCATIYVYPTSNFDDEPLATHAIVPSDVEKIIGNRRYLSKQEKEMLIAIDYFGEKYRINKGR
ncbi:hypothetical protein [Bacteroides sp.]|uniref:hypothetical protein n=1 Tax=Bacteroides sp. TaxID=29523 RepID=UPI002601912D|nr:hypothetical protein [Bacteroides sp.]MDD3039049.1 hypothetical protein [Bacteroides sp.]